MGSPIAYLRPALLITLHAVVATAGCSPVSHWPPAVSSISDIEKLPKTQRDIRGIDIDEPEISLIAGRFLRLDYLFLNTNTSFTDNSARRIAQLEHLHQLVVNDGLQLTDTGLAAISKILALRELIIDNGIKLTDASLDTLGDNSRLQLLYLNGCTKFTSEGKSRIRKQLPNCKIRFD